MAWEIEYTDEFDEWFDGLSDEEQVAVYARVVQLEAQGPHLGGTLVTTIEQSRLSNLKELRVNLGGAYFRILFVFDPRRVGILLLGGDKAGDWNEWYDEHVPRAEAIYHEYLEELRREGLLPPEA
jgi:hypothetical protein